MALGPRLDLRQSQSLVMTPQLQQAIKLLALSNLEIEAFIGEQLDANPLLEMGEAPDLPGPGGDAPVEGLEEGRRTTLESSPIDQLISEGRAADDRPLDVPLPARHRRGPSEHRQPGHARSPLSWLVAGEKLTSATDRPRQCRVDPRVSEQMNLHFSMAGVMSA